MTGKSVKDIYNDPIWDNSKFTKPNGNFEVNAENQLVFIPNKLPPSGISYDNEMILLLAHAERKIGELKGRGDALENPHILIRAYLKREAVLSSKIEGTLASLKDLNMHEAFGSIEKNTKDDLRLQEVINYVNALESALKKIKESEQTINLELVKASHKILMTGFVGGDDKSPGEFRTRQNWIAKTHGTKKIIIYTPPPPEKIMELFENLEKFLQEDHEISVLIQCAFIHYQFEAIHPFLDGNGRIGRLLLPLILYKKGLLPEPLLYLSAYFEKNLKKYYDGLLMTGQKSEWDQWVKFFLNAFIKQADETIKNIQKLVDLQKRYRETLGEKNTSNKIILLMEHMFTNPYITIPQVADYLQVTYPSAKAAVMKLVKEGILKKTDIKFKSKVFLAKKIEAILNVE